MFHFSQLLRQQSKVSEGLQQVDASWRPALCDTRMAVFSDPYAAFFWQVMF